MDEFYFVFKTGGYRALDTLNKTTIFGILNYINNHLLSEDLHFLLNKLLNKFLKEELYQSNYFGFSY